MSREPYASADRVFWIVDNGSSHRGQAAIDRLAEQLIGAGDATVLFWGDTVHCHTVQLRRPSVAFAADSDEPAAIAARRKALDLVSSNRWWVGAAHLPFPGLGHLPRDRYGDAWVPVTYTPVEC
jgi:hypothetical protein